MTKPGPKLSNAPTSAQPDVLAVPKSEPAVANVPVGVTIELNDLPAKQLQVASDLPAIEQSDPKRAFPQSSNAAILQILKPKHDEPVDSGSIVSIPLPVSVLPLVQLSKPETGADPSSQLHLKDSNPIPAGATDSLVNAGSVAKTPAVASPDATPVTAQNVNQSNTLVIEGQIKPIQPESPVPAVVTNPGADISRPASTVSQTNLVQRRPDPYAAGKQADPASPPQEVPDVAAVRSSSGSQSSLSDNSKGNGEGPHSGSRATAPEFQAATAPPISSAAAYSSEIGPEKANISSSKTGTLPMDQQVPTSQTPSKTDLTVRLQGQSGENINVRVSERAGEIQVSIRSTDQATASTLRHELPSIQAGLERAGWQFESDGNAGGQTGRDSSSDSPGQQNKGGRGQEPDGQGSRQRQRNSSTDQWFDLNQ